MRAVIQRVRYARVRVAERPVAAIGTGLLVLLGIAHGDDADTADRLAHKIARLRIFDDEQGRMNLDSAAVGGEFLVVSQFTLLADTRRGHRPSFTAAAPPAVAVVLYERFMDRLRAAGARVAAGQFGAHMQVELLNDGPVTLVMDEPAASPPPRP